MNDAWILEITSPTCIDPRARTGDSDGSIVERRKTTMEQIRPQANRAAHVIHHRSQLSVAFCNQHIDKWTM